MTIMILSKVTPNVRGDLSRWLVEISAGVFVGRVSALVRDSLWSRCVSSSKNGTVIQVWQCNSEQGFDLRAHQPNRYEPVDLDGVWLSRFRDPPYESWS